MKKYKNEIKKVMLILSSLICIFVIVYSINNDLMQNENLSLAYIVIFSIISYSNIKAKKLLAVLFSISVVIVSSIQLLLF